MKRLLLIVILASGCSTMTTYKPAGEGGRAHGYEDVKLADNVYHVRYVGNLNEKQSVIYSLFLRRAAKVTKAEGHKFFIVKDGRFGMHSLGNVGFMARNLPEYQGDVEFLDEKSKGCFEAAK